ncbi:hypothetical protein [Flavobacterium alkalisoli]|uniref:hypothetical protein n=1 Tax=Flavobacterium alkalisoli TaxID=2602769 RepID=UPI003A9375A7
MKKHLITLILLLVAFSVFSQDRESMEKRAGEMYNSIADGNFDQLMDYTYSKLFEIAPRDIILKSFKQMLEGNEEFKIKIINIPPNFTFGEIKKIDEGWYSLIKHDLKMEMIFTEKIESDEKELMIDIFKETMETESVSFNDETNTMTITKKSTMIAIFDSYTNKQWSFINKSKSPLMEKLFSKEVRKELNL